jgi:hypothetical protein
MVMVERETAGAVLTPAAVEVVAGAQVVVLA